MKQQDREKNRGERLTDRPRRKQMLRETEGQDWIKVEIELPPSRSGEEGLLVLRNPC